MNLKNVAKRFLLPVLATLILVVGIVFGSGIVNAANLVKKDIKVDGDTISFRESLTTTLTNAGSKPQWIKRITSRVDASAPTYATYTVEVEANNACTSRSFDLIFNGNAGETVRITQSGKGHTYTTEIQNATYTSAGYRKTYCKECGYVSENTTIPKLKNVSVIFVKNNGEGFETRTMEAGKAYSYWPNVRKTGYDFKGWFTSSGKQVVKTDIVPAQSSITLYAKWEKQILSFSTCSPKNGSTVSSTNGFASVGVKYNTEWHYHFVASDTSGKRISRPEWVYETWWESGAIHFNYQENDTPYYRSAYLCAYTGSKTNNPGSDRIRIWFQITQNPDESTNFNSVLYIPQFMDEYPCNKDEIDKYIKSKYGKSAKTDTKGFIVSNKSTFIEYWNKMPDVQEVVVINTHGSPYGFYNSNPYYEAEAITLLETSDVSRLAPKKIKVIVLLGCNTGHADNHTNMAEAFRKHFNCTVIAPDGTNLFGGGRDSVKGTYIYNPLSDEEWASWASSYRTRHTYNVCQAYGFLAYEKDETIRKFLPKADPNENVYKLLVDRALTLYQLLDNYNNNKLYELDK